MPTACDSLLDLLVVAFAAWTAAYHVCLVLRLGTVVAGILAIVGAAAAYWYVLRARYDTPEEPRLLTRPLPNAPSRGLAAAVVAGLVVLAVILFAYTDLRWRYVSLVWIVAALAGLAFTFLRGEEDRPAEPAGPADLLSSGVVLLWAVGLAVFSLFIVNPSLDDAQYGHLSAWIAAHGSFPLRDTLFSNQGFPAIIYPPVSSFEGLIGTVTQATGISTPTLTYLIATPLVCALFVLALWRLLRSWRVPMTALALSVVLVFLLMDADGLRTPGNLFVARAWQGKVVLLGVLVPVLYVLLLNYVAAPSRRSVLLLAAAGAAGVGLSSTGMFLVPVLAVGTLAPFVGSHGRRALVGAAAASAYPVAAALTTFAVGGRNAAEYTDESTIPSVLAHRTLGHGLFGALGLVAVLAGPAAIRRVAGGRMTASVSLLVALLFAPGVSLFIFHRTGLGTVQWRWFWILPIGALLGALATGLLRPPAPPALRLLPAALVLALALSLGTPVWSARGASVAAGPSWKLLDEDVEAARVVLDRAQPGDELLAPERISGAALVMSGTLTATVPRLFYATALAGVPGAHLQERLLLYRLVKDGRVPPRRGDTKIRRALTALGVDYACVQRKNGKARRALRRAGMQELPPTERAFCFAASP